VIGGPPCWKRRETTRSRRRRRRRDQKTGPEAPKDFHSIALSPRCQIQNGNTSRPERGHPGTSERAVRLRGEGSSRRGFARPQSPRGSRDASRVRLLGQIGRVHVCTPVTSGSRIPSSPSKKK